MEIGFFIGYLISCIVFGCITKYIAGSKGYDGGFGWGFWLGLIGILVVGFRPNVERTTTEYKPMYPGASGYQMGNSNASAKPQSWKCDECGTTNPSSVVTCFVCKKYRYDPPKPKCPHCGATIKNTDEKCFACGKPLKESTSSNLAVDNAEVISLLEKLAHLHEQGILTDEEFQPKKNELLASLKLSTAQKAPSSDEAPKVAKVDLNADEIVCPICNTIQKSNRSCCYHCGKKFIDED